MQLNEIKQTRSTGFDERLSEAQDLFSSKYRTNIIGGDIERVLSESSLFNHYVDSLVEGFEPAVQDQLSTLLENARTDILQESGLTGIQPFHSLSMPMLVKLWARLSMTNALPTEPTNTPAFTIPFARPYMLDAEGNKSYLPESINNPASASSLGLRKVPETVTLSGGKAEGHDLFDGMANIDRELDELDRKFSVTEVTLSDADAPIKLLGEKAMILDGSNNLYAEVSYTDTLGEAQKETLMGHVDLATGTLDFVSLGGKATEIKVQAFLSSEQHTASVQVGTEIERKDITIGTAQHIEGSLPHEMLADVNAMYDVDGAAMITDTMTAVSAQQVDLDIINFLEKAYQGTDAQYTKEFSVIPSETYAMNPSEWLVGLRKTIDYVATSMRNDFKIYNAYYVVVGNPLDTDLIPNVDWTFTQAQDSYNGIDVNFSLGAVRGSNNYKIISSDLINQGELTVFAVPTEENYKTFVYYPYTFNVTSEYLNTRNERVPSIMMTRRYTIEEFTPIIGKIIIKNNDGTVYSRP